MKPSQKRQLFYNYIDKTPVNKIKRLENITKQDLLNATKNKSRIISNTYKQIIEEVNNDYIQVLKENNKPAPRLK